MLRSFLFISFIFVTHVSGQDITAFTDLRDNLQIFDRGVYRQIEYLPVKSYKVGGNSVAYIDNKNDFKIYYNGSSINLMNAADFWYEVSNNITAFRVGTVLYAFDKGEKKTLSYYAGYTAFDDSVLVYFDESESTLNFYYNGRIANAEESFLGKPKAIQTGSNIVAWVNQSNYFTIFYHGQIKVIDNISPLAFAAGQDIVAYVDDYVRQFKIFYKGEIAVAEQFLPDSFKVGWGTCAYIDDLSNFRIFYNGASIKILSERPDFFYAHGNIVAYSSHNTFNVFYKGRTFALGSFVPSDFQLGNEGIAWLDENGRLMVFHKGTTYTAAYDVIESYSLNGNVLKYDVGNKTFRVWYNGERY